MANNSIDLAKYRIERARDCLQSAEREAKADSFKTAANRSYYAIFHSIRAVLALDNFDSKKHSGIIAAFRERYIKAGKFAPHFSDVIGEAFEVRNNSDYQDFYVVPKSDVIEQIENAKLFLEAVVKYINSISEEE
jgi:uncharacterized protein (UPF0332 family)